MPPLHRICLVIGALCLSVFYIQHASIRTQEELSYNDNNKLSGEYLQLLTSLHSSVKRKLVDGRIPIHKTIQNSSYTFPAAEPTSQCSQYKTRFGRDLPRVWLASYPCSGNTWVRYLVEAATGIFSGSIFGDLSLYKAGYLGEKDDPASGRTIVQKTHLSSLVRDTRLVEKLRGKKTIPTVLLIRNPAKALISHYKYDMRGNHTGQLPDSAFETKDFHAFVENGIVRWRELTIHHLLWTEAPLYILYYDNLLQDTFKELTNLLTFLGAPIDEGRMECLFQHLEGQFKRKNSSAIDPFTSKEKSELIEAAKAMNRTIMTFGYPPLPTYSLQ